MRIKNEITDLNGDLKKNRITDDIILEKNEKAIKQHIDLLLLCSVHASIGRPYLCAGLREFIAEPVHSGTLEEIKSRVRNSLKYENRARADFIDVRWEEDSKVVTIEIEFTMVSADKTFTYITRLRRVS
ncbi:baseplate wedge subunit [Agrobacterium phage OLIVR5]|uniref:Baseplate wedge subunit n=3 Tax=Caudoviricetes TaxID=2731619 RepID=A0A858MT61_9CAUD|nr:baseplate wedge subunit [Agrobacterium phage OLIVR5]QIW87779.1 baseplate wedge subunit [Agrobacterium phage OLIVR5]QIW88043.1 baseplate wedge subunit [Agrobacterium phage OLIVR6]